MGRTTPTTRTAAARTLAKAAGAGLTVALAAGAGAGLRYAAAELGVGSAAPPTSGASSCDGDGVSIGYDLRYAAAVHAYVVAAVRVAGIDPACDGAALGIG